MTVDGEPNVRVCVTPVREGAVVTGQNVVGSLDRDLMRVVDRLGRPFMPPGFYYKTFIRPRRLWPLYERVLRRAAGLGKLDPDGARSERVEVIHEHADVVVVGGGEAGLEAAIAAASLADRVIVVDEGPDVGGALLADRVGHARAAELRRQALAAGVRLLVPAVAIGVFEYGLVPVAHGDTLVKIRARKVIVAAGAMEQPLVFPGNDLVGVMLPEAVRRLVNLWSVAPGSRAFVVTADDRGLAAAADLTAAGVEMVGVLDLPRGAAGVGRGARPARPRRVVRRGRARHGLRSRRDVRKPAARRQAPRAGRRPGEYDRARGVFVPTELPPGVEAVGAASGRVGEPAIPPAVARPRGRRCFVCLCEDQTTRTSRTRSTRASTRSSSPSGTRP